jgi:hypothetical protein
VGEITACQICSSDDLTVILDMGEQPLAENFSSGKRYPLALQQCGDCTLVQLTYAVDQREVFPLDHPYASGNTKALVEHFMGLSNRVARYLGDGDLIVDIGANDGTFLGLVRPGVRRVAVEPTDQAKKCTQKGIDVWQNFFTWYVSAGIRECDGFAKVITAANVLAHVPDCHDFVQNVADLLADDGVFVTENHLLTSVVDGLQVDAIYAEHLRYYSPTSLARLLGMHGLTITEMENVPTHGGSFRVFARKLRVDDFAKRATGAAEKLLRMLADIAGHGEAVYGVGAATRATPLIHFAGIAPYLTCVCEIPGSEKIGHNMPGTQVPVVDEVRLLEDQPPYAILFSWQWAESITRKLRAAGYKGRWIVPLPEPRILPD